MPNDKCFFMKVSFIASNEVFILYFYFVLPSVRDPGLLSGSFFLFQDQLYFNSYIQAPKST